MPFVFRLEQVLDYRKQLEEQAMQKLADAQKLLENACVRLASLRSELLEQNTRLAHPETFTGPELWLLREYVKALRSDIETCQHLIGQYERNVADCRATLVERAKDKKLLENLKAKQSLRYAEEEQLKEQRDNDETATIRYGRTTG